jgi:tripartite-type tricarboxylate transporter receptor subunit TctC
MLRNLGSAALGVVLILLIGPCPGARAQITGAIKIIVPVPPGGSPDILARLLADQIGRAHGLTIVVENRPGAAGALATDVVARAKADGGTLLMGAPPAFVIHPHLRKLTYDPLTSFEPICNLVRSPTVIVVNETSRYRTLADLLNAGRANPGELTVAGIGPASVIHIAFEKLKRASSTGATFVPYPGTAPALNALLGKYVTAVFGNYGDMSALLNAGKLRAIAIASQTRIESLPDVPTVAESGFLDYEADVWYGLLAPAKTPKSTTIQLAAWLTAAIQTPELKSRLGTLGLFPVGVCGVDFAAYIRNQYDEYGRIIREANISEQ